jgi:hypothetical protein
MLQILQSSYLEEEVKLARRETRNQRKESKIKFSPLKILNNPKIFQEYNLATQAA